eukprot:CAMPEP_0176043690 /NCGR_PEP_ID=MMETSP0120_2-20121206/21684_1 /TAXON_ID=160619 /ORGANISM="Kryptoperidinium foliaceum, Strain CCMP 1326" /LENGTH=272 /DNA_ID=CAMNT_0017377101 /DNA_START=78 /DNA_END=896 /DNA_ORIENTATION=-
MAAARLALPAMMLLGRFVMQCGALDEAAVDGACLLQHRYEGPDSPHITDPSGVADPLVYVLSINTTLGRVRRAPLLADLPKVGVTSYDVVEGLFAGDFPSLEDFIAAAGIPWSEEQNRSWAESMEGPGSLGCAMGHHRIWQLAQAALSKPGAPRWAVVLEDDALVKPGKKLRDVLAKVPEKADIAFLDNFHCKHHEPGLVGTELYVHSTGSIGYAVTARGAATLLAEKLIVPSDGWLNVVIRGGKAFGWCGEVVFEHNYRMKSERRYERYTK